MMTNRKLFLVLKRFATTGSGYDYRNVREHKVTHQYTADRFRPLRLTRYGGVNTVTMLAGGGIGPEMMDAVKRVFVATRAPVDFEEIKMDPNADTDKCNRDFAHGLISIRRNGVALKGHIESHKCDPTDYSRNVALRRNLDLFVNVITFKSYPCVRGRHDNIDLVVVRQNTEGEYLMLEHETVPGLVENMKVVTAYNSERIARYTFEFARRNNRKKVLCIHRRPILPACDGLFVDTICRVAAEYPDIGYAEKSVSSTIRGLSLQPSKYDMIVCTNLSGSTINNMMFGIMGSPALYSSRNYGDHYAVFETGHRSKGSSMTGQGVANPVAMLNASVDLLRYLGHEYHACLINKAIDQTINVDHVHTCDLGGTATTDEVVDNIIERVADAGCVIPEGDPGTRLPNCGNVAE